MRVKMSVFDLMRLKIYEMKEIIKTIEYHTKPEVTSPTIVSAREELGILLSITERMEKDVSSSLI